MTETPPEELVPAIRLLQAGQSAAAQPLLTDFVRSHPDSDMGWFLLSLTLPNRQQQVDCLQRVLRLNPNHGQARDRLAKLGAGETLPPVFSKPTSKDQVAPVRASSYRPPVERPESKPAFFEPPDFSDPQSVGLAEVQPATSKSVSERPSPPAPSGADRFGDRRGDWVTTTAGDEPPGYQAALAEASLGAHYKPDSSGAALSPEIHLRVDAASDKLSAPEPPARGRMKAFGEDDPEVVDETQEASPSISSAPSDSSMAVAEAQPVAKPGTLSQVPQSLRLVGLLAGAGLVIVVILAGLLARRQSPGSPAGESETAGSMLATGTSLAVAIQPSKTATRTPTLTRTATPTRTPTMTRTYPPPNRTMAAQMETIQQQVADLRGLSIQTQVPRYVLSSDKVRSKLEGLFDSYSSRAELATEARVLSALGLIKPTYDLYNYSISGLGDSLGGFYLPWTKELFVKGDKFSGMEKYVFSHEYDHALVDQHFHISDLGTYPACTGDEQRCDAIRALIEGDATVLMNQWLAQYASPRDYLDIGNYDFSTPNLPEQFPPPYVVRDVSFPYVVGANFVKFLYKRGNWAQVNRAYSTLPQSTEQILHPEKYLAGEGPIRMSDPPLSSTLSSDWQLLKSNSLGEWSTYLLLGYGADVAAELKDDAASSAARGWGGDHYQVYYNATLTETVLAAHWVWDTAADATEFQQAMRVYQDNRFRGSKVKGSSGDCWEANHQTSCIYMVGKETLWLLAPDQTVLNEVRSRFPNF